MSQHDRAGGGWPQRRELAPVTRFVVGALVAVAIVGAMIALVVFTDDNADRIPPPHDDGSRVYVD